MSLLDHKYVVMARREYWENRSLWMAPGIVAIATLVLPLVGGVNLGDRDGGVTFNAGDDPMASTVVPPMFGQATMVGTVMMLGGVASLAIFAYLLDCLYGERKDRSILFWKSLPVSDAETVLVKLAVAMVLTPVLVMLLSMVVQPLLLGVMNLRFEELRVAINGDSVLAGWKLLPKYAMAWLYGTLWYSPGIAWLLLASVLAKRAPLIYALMPPLAVVLLEGIVLGERRVLRFLGEWLFPWTRSDWAWDFDPERGVVPGMGSPDWPVLLTNASLWIGVAIAVGVIYGVIRLRRYRDDT